jgi:phenylacetate-CoA ligase
MTMNNFQNIYLRLPVFLQNTFLSLYGYRLHINRYAGQYSRFKKEADLRLQLGREALEKYRFEQLKCTLKDAFENVEYYKNICKNNRISVEDIQTIADLRIFPLLDKESIRSAQGDFISKKYNLKSLQVIHTTGSTGTPLNIFCTPEVRQNNYAFYDRFLEIAGIPSGGKRATFGGRIIVPSNQKAPPFWRNSALQKNMLFSSYHLTEKNIPFYIEALRRYQPDLIDSYPSSLAVVADFARRHGIDLKNITKGITTSAETLLHEQREVISSAFGVPVIDQYGAAEMCIFAGQCSHGSIHIHSDYGIVEFLKTDGSEGKPGEECELVCTGFINPVMPLIRYRIGDVAVLSGQDCPCGMQFPVLDKLVGRKDDSIITPDGRTVGRLSPVLKGFPIKEAQYFQDSRDVVEVRIVRDNGFTEKTETECKTALRDRLGDSIVIKMIYVDKIERGTGGKLRTVVSRIPKNPG